ncbi:hypothetical protein ABZX90_38495 [Streptomyces sp. NPDC002935]|uniref:hypothetical protein n=1 Tax=Streptomyces sp. NPDC002935 TaxID=3154545 RepID=UPI0033A8D239
MTDYRGEPLDLVLQCYTEASTAAEQLAGELSQAADVTRRTTRLRRRSHHHPRRRDHTLPQPVVSHPVTAFDAAQARDPDRGFCQP